MSLTITELAARARWEAIVQYAAARGVSADTLRQIIHRPSHRGGIGWAWWRETQTTEELAAALRRRVDAMKGGT